MWINNFINLVFDRANSVNEFHMIGCSQIQIELVIRNVATNMRRIAAFRVDLIILNWPRMPMTSAAVSLSVRDALRLTYLM